MDKHTKELISLAASDLLTGNYLLGRIRPAGYKSILNTIGKGLNKIINNQPIDKLEKSYLIQLSSNFHDGIEDMAEQLNIDKSLVLKALNN